MRLTALVTILAAVLTMGFPQTARAAECQFVLGFKALHDQIPAVVGQCLENEQHNPSNGDGIQRTSGGLLVWRKADNVTAFTDGYRTWLNGPLGLQSRLNTQRFDWEFSCLNVGARQCLRVEPILGSAVRDLQSLGEGRSLLQPAANLGIRALSVPTPPGVRGGYDSEADVIVIDSRLEGSTDRVRAAVLAHELQHAADDAVGLLANSGAPCFEAEARAFRTQARVWQEFYPGGLPSGGDQYERELNDITRTVTQQPDRFAAELIRNYWTECVAPTS